MINKKTFKAGAARVDITPPQGTFVGVDFFNHYARFIHDPLHAKALVFENDGLLVAIVIVDICIMPSDLMSDIKSRIHQQTGVQPENIMLSCTHTHGAGNVAGLLCGSVDIAYRTKIPDLIVKAVDLAIGKMKPAKVATGSTEVPEHVLCRRYLMKKEYSPLNPVTGEVDLIKTNPFGVEQFIERPAEPVDPGVGFLAIKGMDESWIALLGNYCLHYVGDWHVDSITADYYGEFSRQIHQKLGAGNEFVGMMSYGTGGDVNIWDFMDPDRYPEESYAKTRLIAGDLSDKVAEALQTVHWDENPALNVRYEELELDVRKPSPDELDTARKRLEENDFNNLEINHEGMLMVYAREQILLEEYPSTSPASVQAIQVGELIIGALGGEFFSETGLSLKSSVPATNYFTVCLANTYDGYVPPAHEFDRGGYETWRARSSFLERNAESKIRNKLLDLIGKMI